MATWRRKTKTCTDVFLTLWLSRAALVTMISDKIITTKTTTSQRVKLFLYNFFSFQERTFWISAKRGIFSWNIILEIKTKLSGKKSKSILWTNVSAKQQGSKTGHQQRPQTSDPTTSVPFQNTIPSRWTSSHRDHNNGFLLTNIFPDDFFPSPLTKLFSCVPRHFLVKSQYRRLQLRVLVH